MEQREVVRSSCWMFVETGRLRRPRIKRMSEISRRLAAMSSQGGKYVVLKASRVLPQRLVIGST
jgi:hypothetical protein